ncbi:TPA: hypothetical protein ACY380_002139 [Pasteurella multocida]
MALTKKEIQNKSDKKRGVRMAGFKLHEDIIKRLEQLSKIHSKSKTEIVSEGIKQTMRITIHISNQCKESHFYDIEYAGALYEELSSSYPLAQINFIFTKTKNSEIKAPYITGFSTANIDPKEIEPICIKVCKSLMQDNRSRILNPPNGDVLPLNFKNFKTEEEIEDYLKEKGVELSTYGYFENFV